MAILSLPPIEANAPTERARRVGSARDLAGNLGVKAEAGQQTGLRLLAKNAHARIRKTFRYGICSAQYGPVQVGTAPPASQVLNLPVQLIAQMPPVHAVIDLMVRPERFELPTLWFEAKCSIHLSYGRTLGFSFPNLTASFHPASGYGGLNRSRRSGVFRLRNR